MEIHILRPLFSEHLKQQFQNNVPVMFCDHAEKWSGIIYFLKNGILWDVMSCGSCKNCTLRRNTYFFILYFFTAFPSDVRYRYHTVKSFGGGGGLKLVATGKLYLETHTHWLHSNPANKGSATAQAVTNSPQWWPMIKPWLGAKERVKGKGAIGIGFLWVLQIPPTAPNSSSSWSFTVKYL
jgi:hypothetical protein